MLGLFERARADVGDFAARALTGGLIGGVLSQGGGKIRRRTGTQRTTLPSTQDGQEIQTSLNYFGFNVGRVDGQLGRKSKEAISQYQAYLGYPVSGQLSPYGQELLVSSYQRAVASGYMATQQAMSHPDGQRGLLKIYLAERRVQQPNFPQQQNQPQYNQAATMMVNGATDAYGQQQYGQAGQQPVYGAAIQPNVQTFGAQQQFAPQQQQQFVPQQQFAAQPQQVQPQYAPQQQPVPQQFATQSGAVTAQLDAATTVLQASAPTQQTQSLATLANRRWALVVGVDGYENLEDLKKARNDAQAVGQALTRLGFEVRTLYDPSRRDMNSAVSTMANQIDPGDEVLFYFAGHGVEVEGAKFLAAV